MVPLLEYISEHIPSLRTKPLSPPYSLTSVLRLLRQLLAFGVGNSSRSGVSTRCSL